MERQHFNVSIPAGFEHLAAVHTPIIPRGIPNAKDRYLVCFPPDERFTGIRINSRGSQGAYGEKQPMLFIGDGPASDHPLWQTLAYDAQRWSMPLDRLLTGMALTAAITMYEYFPKYRAPGEPREKYALLLNAVRIESDIPKPNKCEPLQQWIADKRAMWEI